MCRRNGIVLWTPSRRARPFISLPALSRVRNTFCPDSRSSVNNDVLHGHHNSRCQLPIVASASFVALCIYGLHATTRGADGLNGMGFGQRTAKERLRTRTKVGFCPLIDQLHSHPVPYLKRLLATALDSVPPSAVPPWQHPPLQPVSKSPFSTRTGEYG